MEDWIAAENDPEGGEIRGCAVVLLFVFFLNWIELERRAR